MIRASASTMISRTPSQVFEFIADIRSNYQRWSPEVIKLEVHTSGPIRVGTRARQIRIDKGKRTDSLFRVSAFQPYERIEFQGTTNPFRATYEVAEAADRTRLTFVFELSRLDAFMRPFEKLIRTSIQQGADRIVKNIKHLVETETPSEPAPTQRHTE